MIMTLFRTKLLKSVTLKCALYLSQCQVEVDTLWNDRMVEVDAFQS